MFLRTSKLQNTLYLWHHFRLFSTSYISQKDAGNTLWCGYNLVIQIYQNWSTRFLWFIIDWNNRPKFAISFNVLILVKIMFAIYFKVCWWIVILFNSWQKIPSEIEKGVVDSQRINLQKWLFCERYKIPLENSCVDTRY